MTTSQLGLRTSALALAALIGCPSTDSSPSASDSMHSEQLAESEASTTPPTPLEGAVTTPGEPEPSSPPAPDSTISAPEPSAPGTDSAPPPPVASPPPEPEPDPGASPDEPMIELLGEDASEWQHANGMEVKWGFDAGVLTVAPGSGDIRTLQQFGDALVHIEFQTPERPANNTDQAFGNSDVYVQGRYEVQINENFGYTPGLKVCGALYDVKPPDENACTPGGIWQTFVSSSLRRVSRERKSRAMPASASRTTAC